MDLNFDLFSYLLWATDKKTSDANRNAGKILCINLLGTFAYKNTDLASFFQEGILEIGNERIPWTLKTGPITRDKVRNALSQFDESILSGLITLVSAN